MVITYHDKSYFKLQSGEKVILINPTDQRSFKGATAILKTYFDENEKIENSESEPLFINTPGEYDISDITIYGKKVNSAEEKDCATAFKIIFDEMIFGFMPELLEKPDMKDMEIFENLDILILPADKNQKEAAILIRQLKPGLVIPYFTKEKNSPDILLKELGKEKMEGEEKITIKKKEIAPGAINFRWIKR